MQLNALIPRPLRREYIDIRRLAIRNGGVAVCPEVNVSGSSVNLRIGDVAGVMRPPADAIDGGSVRRTTTEDAPIQPQNNNEMKDDSQMANISKSLEEAMKIDGAIAAALADWDSGLCLGTAGGGVRLNIEIAAAGNCQVVKAKMNTMNELGIRGAIHDILITLDDQIHLIRPLKKYDNLFLYIAVDKAKGNLGLARHRLQKIESELVL